MKQEELEEEQAWDDDIETDDLDLDFKEDEDDEGI